MIFLRGSKWLKFAKINNVAHEPNIFVFMIIFDSQDVNINLFILLFRVLIWSLFWGTIFIIMFKLICYKHQLW